MHMIAKIAELVRSRSHEGHSEWRHIYEIESACKAAFQTIVRILPSKSLGAHILRTTSLFYPPQRTPRTHFSRMIENSVRHM